jgi:hypothetical protein
MDARDALRGAGYGIVQGAAEIGADHGEAAAKAVEAARRVAEQAGLTEEQAALYVARGALDAAASMGAEALAQVEAACLRMMMPIDFGERRT